MSRSPTCLRWPLHAGIRILLAGRFPLAERNFAVAYCHPRGPALHLHHYAGRWRVPGREYALRPGDVTFSPALLPTRYDLPAPGHHLCIHFAAKEKMTRGGPMLRLPLHLSLGPRGTAVAERLGLVMHWHRLSMEDSSPHRRMLAEEAAAAIFKEILIELAWQAQEQRSSRTHRAVRLRRHSEQALRQLVELIDGRLAEPLPVAELAERVGLTQNYLARLFKERMGMTIQRYRLARRVDLARNLLTTTHLPIGLIARRVGLPDPQHFNKAFRRVTGQSPSALRQQSR